MTHERPVLIVEDNAETRYVLDRALGISGYVTRSTRSADEALDFLRDGGAPAAIILDLRMPGMDGRTLLKALKADALWRHIPVIVYSADPGNVPDAVACVRKGSDDPDVLLAAVAGCMKNGRLRDSA